MHAVLNFEYQPCWAAQLVRRFNLRVRMLSETARRSDIQDEAIVWGKDRESVDRALEFIPRHPHILGLAVTKRSKDGLIVRLRVNVRRQMCPLYAALQLFSAEDRHPILERVDCNGVSQWSLDTRKVEEVTELLYQRFHVDDVRVKERHERGELRKSIFMLKEAYEKGYFDVPKSRSLRSIAREMGVPVSTLSVDVRRSLKDVVDRATR